VTETPNTVTTTPVTTTPAVAPATSATSTPSESPSVLGTKVSKKVTPVQVSRVPGGGVQAGAGSTGGLQHTGLLALGGSLLVETSERQAPQAVEAAARSGLVPRVASSEELNATVVIATRPASRSGPGS